MPYFWLQNYIFFLIASQYIIKSKKVVPYFEIGPLFDWKLVPFFIEYGPQVPFFSSSLVLVARSPVKILKFKWWEGEGLLFAKF